MHSRFFLAVVLGCLVLPVRAESSFISPEFHALMVSVRDDHPAVAAARAAVEAASARRAASDQPLYNPSLTLENERGEVTTTAVGLSQTVDLSDKRGAERDIAAAALTVAEAQLAVAQRQITGELLQALIYFQTAREQHQLALRRERLMQKFSTAAQQRFAAGDITQSEATLARLALSEAQTQQARINKVVIEAEAALREVTGQSSTAWPDIAPALPPPPAGVDVDTALLRLPEIRVQLAQIAKAQAQARLASRSQRPDPTVSVRGGKEGGSALIGVAVEIPLFVRRNFRLETEATDRDLAQTEQTLDETRRRLRARLEGALARYRAAASAWQTWEAAGRADLAEQVELLGRLWEAGELSAADYLVQAHQTVEAQQQEVELASEARLAAIAWLQAAGLFDEWLSSTRTSSEIGEGK